MLLVHPTQLYIIAVNRINFGRDFKGSTQSIKSNLVLPQAGLPRPAKPNFSDSRPFSAVSRARLKINLNRRSFFTFTATRLYCNRTPSTPVSSTIPTHITSAPTSAPPHTRHGFRRNRLGHHQQPILLLQTQASRQRQQRPKVHQIHLLPQRAQRHRSL